MKNSNCIIITQKEWLNWLAFGYLRVSPSRISYFDNTESSFDILMSYSVDNALDEEDAYLLASLVDDYSREELHIKRTPFSDHISIQAVQEFSSLSVKGHNLLKNEMEQSHSILNHDSKIEKLWSEWKNTQFRLRNHDKGNKFLEILDYQKFEVEPKVDDDTLFNRVLKNYNRRNLHSKLQDRHKRSSFAWLVINQEFNEKIGKILYRKYYDFRKNSQNVEIQDIAKTYKFLEDSFITNDSDSLFDYPLLIAEKSFFDKWHSDNSEPKEHYLASTILVHYYNILESNYDINLLSLSKDLTLLDKIYSTKDISQLIAYFIGKRLNEVYLNSLYIAKNIDEKKPSMFDTNFFSNLKNEKLTLCNVNQVQLQEIIRKVHVIAEEIKLAYNNIEVNKIQEPEIGTETIENSDTNLNQFIQSQKPMENNDNIKIDNITLKEKEYTPNNTTDNYSTQPRSEAQKLADSEESEDSTNRIGDLSQPTQSQKLIKDNDNIKINNTLPTEKLGTPSNTTSDDSNHHYSETQKPEESEYNTKDMNNPDEIECDTNLSNLSTTINNENETIKRDQIQEGEQMSLSMESTTEKRTPINPTELLRDAISTINELPKSKNDGNDFRNLLFSKNARYKDEFKNSERLSNFFEAFAKIVGNDMKKHTRFAEFKKELLLNDSLPNK